ncbi:MAG: GNAT family N-acetyltransferase [Acidilobaceae archaeon]|nr:GNAT family N-acetyltransferase [Acidilobaceae archaeon]MCX8164978.1 GNAT family N-acetyltransferase [Acidilobaceae archaeon]MDW7974505.1 GNAT family N-acetyltransferase [Sulfolobales archaeon]
MRELPSCGVFMGSLGEVTIRGACAEDLERLLPFYESLDAESLLRRFHGFVGDFRAYVEGLRRAGAFVSIAELEGKVVGAGEAVPIGEDAVEVGVVVARELRGRGLGTAMAKGMLELCRSHGVRRFVAYTDPDNVPAIRIARKFGASISMEGDLVKIVFSF